MHSIREIHQKQWAFCKPIRVMGPFFAPFGGLLPTVPGSFYYRHREGCRVVQSIKRTISALFHPLLCLATLGVTSASTHLFWLHFRPAVLSVSPIGNISHLAYLKHPRAAFSDLDGEHLEDPVARYTEQDDLFSDIDDRGMKYILAFGSGWF